MQSLYLVYLDRSRLGDPLFLKSLAQHFAEGRSGEPACILVHGSGEKVERTLEAEGYFPERTEGVLQVETDEQRHLVERAVRETNQEIVAALTDEVVSTVGIQGVDRNLLGRADDGTLTARNVGWLAALIKQRVVPVVSALADEEGAETREVWTADVVVALARALSGSFDPVACFLGKTDRAGIGNGEGTKDEVAVDSIPDDDVADPAAIRRIYEVDVPVLVTNLPGLLGSEGPNGTRIRGGG